MASTHPPHPFRPQIAKSCTLVLGVLCLLVGGGCAQGEEEAPRPTREQLAGAAEGWNVVLISVDTLRADHLNAFGYERRETSPNINNLSQSGLRFLEASAPRAATWPSLATVLTGLYPSGHGIYQNQMGFAPETPTLPKILSAAGYTTGAFLSNMCRANHDGWDTRNCSRNASDEDLLRNAAAWLETVAPTEEAGQAAPVFLWAHFFGAHGPYYNGGNLGEQLNPGYDGIVAPKRGVLNRIMTGATPLDEADLDHLNALYDAAIIGTDERIGRLLQSIEQHLDLDRTLIVFLSDHGEELYEHNRYLYHACSVYQSTLRVPLAIVAPGLIDSGAMVHQPVELSDVLPTLLDLLAVDRQDTCTHGESLLGYLAQPNRSGVGKLALSEYGLTPIGTARRGQWKLIENPTNHREVCLPDTDVDFYPIGEVELYDLANDPGETQNLATSEPAKVLELTRARLERVKGLCSTGVKLDPADLTEEQIKEMRAMGYVVG